MFRNFVAISGEYDQQKRVYMSGFLVRLRDYMFYLTAGHVMVDEKDKVNPGLRSLLDSGLLTSLHLVDSLSDLSCHTDVIPFVMESDRLHVGGTHEDGNDFAAYVLRPNTVSLLCANGNYGYVESQWMNVPDYDGKDVTDYLVGLPSSHTHLRLVNLTVLNVEPISMEDSPKALHFELPHYYARLLSPDIDINGMSGGPVLRVDHRNAKVYLLAIQSCWSKLARVIAAHPVGGLLTKIAEAIDEEKSRVGLNSPASANR